MSQTNFNYLKLTILNVFWLIMTEWLKYENIVKLNYHKIII